MSLEPKSCPKCQTPMSNGFLIDYNYAETRASSWHPEPIEKTWWGFGSVKVLAAKTRQIVACRCGQCGFLELYAPNK